MEYYIIKLIYIALKKDQYTRDLFVCWLKYLRVYITILFLEISEVFSDVGIAGWKTTDDGQPEGTWGVKTGHEYIKFITRLL